MNKNTHTHTRIVIWKIIFFPLIPTGSHSSSNSFNVNFQLVFLSKNFNNNNNQFQVKFKLEFKILYSMDGWMILIQSTENRAKNPFIPTVKKSILHRNSYINWNDCIERPSTPHPKKIWPYSIPIKFIHSLLLLFG